MKMTKVAIVTSKAEYLRFTKKIIDCDLIIEHEKPITYLNFLKIDFQNSIFYFMGLRAPDVFLIKNLYGKCEKIIVFQHAFNENNIIKSASYILNNFFKFFMWSISICLSYFLKAKKNIKTIVECFYFTKYYKKRLTNFIHNARFIRCSDPDPTIYGTQKKIVVKNDKVDYFYIDEPLTKSLGITKKEENKLIENLISNYDINKLYVKLHPRSKKDKFTTFKRIAITENIYKNCQNLVGYQSNLLRYNFKSKNFIMLNRDLKSWSKVAYLTYGEGSYVDDVKKHLK